MQSKEEILNILNVYKRNESVDLTILYDKLTQNQVYPFTDLIPLDNSYCKQTFIKKMYLFLNELMKKDNLDEYGVKTVLLLLLVMNWYTKMSAYSVDGSAYIHETNSDIFILVPLYDGHIIVNLTDPTDDIILHRSDGMYAPKTKLKDVKFYEAIRIPCTAYADADAFKNIKYKPLYILTYALTLSNYNYSGPLEEVSSKKLEYYWDSIVAFTKILKGSYGYRRYFEESENGTKQFPIKREVFDTTENILSWDDLHQKIYVSD